MKKFGYSAIKRMGSKVESSKEESKTCFACGGMVTDGMSDGGLVDDDEASLIDLEPTEDSSLEGPQDEDGKKSNFLNHYMTTRTLRGGK